MTDRTTLNAAAMLPCTSAAAATQDTVATFCVTAP